MKIIDMADMNPENNRDTFQGRGHRIKELEAENAEMKLLLKTIWESDALRSEDEELHDMVGKFVKEPK
jgi:hypothetical protein